MSTFGIVVRSDYPLCVALPEVVLVYIADSCGFSLLVQLRALMSHTPRIKGPSRLILQLL